MVSRWNSSGIFSQDSPHSSSATKSKEFLSKMSVEPEDFTGTDHLHVDVQGHPFSWEGNPTTSECLFAFISVPRSNMSQPLNTSCLDFSEVASLYPSA